MIARPARVIGVGNLQRGDDAAGILAVRRLRRRHPGRFEVVECEGEMSALFDAWDGAGRAVVVDAVRAGVTPGTLHRFDAIATRLQAGIFVGSTHAFGVAEAVELARSLGILPPALVVVGIEVQRFTLGAPLSPGVAAALDRLVDRVAVEAAAPAAANPHRSRA